MPNTFKVCELKSSFETCTDRVNTKPIKNILVDFFKSKLESCSDPDKQIINNNTYNLLNLVCFSFNKHYPLILSPDLIWNTILQSISTHVNLNAEKVRKQFVNFDGKIQLSVQRDSFIKDDFNNNWAGCFPEFSDQISEYIGPKRDLIVSNFSTTTPLTKAVSEIGLMETMKSYFDYACYTLCGIPRVTLEGNVEDWENIRARVVEFKKLALDFDFYWDMLLPALDELVNAAKGNPNIDFWKNFYNEGGGSGGPFVSGNVRRFYAYDKNEQINKLENNHSCPRDYPNLMFAVPFMWFYHGTKYSMHFNGGVVGYEQNEDGSVQASFGWAVREASVCFMNYPKSQ